jgi:hypothetical protein
MHRLPIAIVLTFTVFISCAYSLVLGKEEAPRPLSNTDVSQKALADMLNSFQLYLNFFQNSYPQGNFNISNHGESYDDALAYFMQGFEQEMAINILSLYTFTNEETGKLQILPTDGLPVLVEEDCTDITWSFIDSRHIVFEHIFYNYYGENNNYSLKVYCSYDGQNWKIYQLQWEPLLINTQLVAKIPPNIMYNEFEFFSQEVIGNNEYKFTQKC